jgi:hypothetical protein
MNGSPLLFAALFAAGCQSTLATSRPPPLALPSPATVFVHEATNVASAPEPVHPAEAAPVAPGWAVLYARYFGPESDGSCGRSRACHADVMTDADSAYIWLTQRGYVAGAQSPLVSAANSCLRWFGGNMPPRGTPNDDAVRDLRAWVAAGAARN